MYIYIYTYIYSVSVCVCVCVCVCVQLSICLCETDCCHSFVNIFSLKKTFVFFQYYRKPGRGSISKVIVWKDCVFLLSSM